MTRRLTLHLSVKFTLLAVTFCFSTAGVAFASNYRWCAPPSMYGGNTSWINLSNWQVVSTCVYSAATTHPTSLPTSSDAVTIDASSNFFPVLSGNVSVSSLTLNTGTTLNLAGHSVTLTNNSGSGTGLVNYGAISNTSGSAAITVESGTLTNSGSITSSSGGTVTLSADAVSLSSGTITAGSGLVTIVPYTNTYNVDIGSGATATTGVLAITDAELNTISTSGGLTIGSTTTAGNGSAFSGNVTVVGTLTLSGTQFTGVTPLLLASNTGTVEVTAALTSPIAVTLTAPTIDLNYASGDVITTSGQPVTFNGAVVLTANTTLSSGGGAVDFTSTVQNSGSAPSGGYALTVNKSGGLLTFAQAVGISGSPLASVVTDTGGTIALNGGSVTTSGVQTYGGAVTLGATTTLDSSSGNGAITFDSTVEGSGAGGQGLTISTGTGATTFGNKVGDKTALGAIQISSDAMVFNGGGGSIHGTSTIELEPSVVGDSVGIGGPTPAVTGTLQVTATDMAALASGFSEVEIGQASGTNAVTVGSGGATFTSPVLLQSNGSGGSVVLDGPVSAGANAVTLTAPTIDLNYASASGNVITTSGQAVTFNGAVVLTANTTLSSGGGAVDFTSTVQNSATAPSGGYALTVNKTGGLLTFGNAVGTSASPLASVVTDAGGTIALDGGSVTTSGVQTYGGAVTLGATTTLTGGSGQLVRFESTVSGAYALTVSTADAEFDGAVGSSTTPLSLVYVTSGATTIKATGITTSGGQTYEGSVTLGTATTLDSSAGTGGVTFGSTVDGGYGLTIAAGTGTATFGGIVGGGTPLTGLTLSSGTLDTNSYGITVNGGVTIDSGGVMNAGASPISVVGNWSNNSGTFTAGSSTVQFTPATAGTSAISGSTTFYNLSCTVGGATLQFANGQTQTVSGTLTLTGTSATQLLTLEGTSTGLPAWTISPTGTTNVSYVGVQDSVVGSTAQITAANSFSIGANNSTAANPGPSGGYWVFETPVGYEPFTWKGTAGGNWFNPSNWKAGSTTGVGIPGITDQVVINSAGPTLTGAVVMGSLSIGSSGTLTTGSGGTGFNVLVTTAYGGLGGFTLNGTGALTDSATGGETVTLQGTSSNPIDFLGGTYTANHSTLAITGNSTTLSYASSGSINNLSVDMSSGQTLTLGSAVTVAGTSATLGTSSYNFTDAVGTIDLSGNSLSVTTGAAGLGAVIENTGTAATFTVGGATTLTGNASVSTNGGTITLAAITGGGNNLTLVSGVGTTTVSGAASGLGTVTLQAITTSSTGGVSFGSSLGAVALDTFAEPYSLTVANAAISGATSTTIANSAGFTLSGSSSFTAGLTATSGTNIFSGTVSSSGNILLSKLTIGSGGVTFNTGSAGTLSVTGATTGSGQSLTIANTAGASFAGVGSSASRVGGVTLASTIATTGTITFGGALYAASLTAQTGSAGYSVTLSSGGEVSGATSLSNTGEVTVAAGFLFYGGVTANGTSHPSNVNLAGTVASYGAAILFPNITLTADTTIDTTDGALIPTGGNISLGSIAGGGYTLTLDSGSSGAITATGAADAISTLTLQNSNGATFQSSYGATTPGIVDIPVSQQGGVTIAFQGSTDITTLTTAASGYSVDIIGATNTVSSATTFLNTGGVTLGSSGGTTTFTNGIATSGSSSNPATTTLSGSIDSTGAPATFGTTTVAASTTVSTSGGAVDITGPVDSTSTGPQSLTVNAGSGLVTLGGAEGGNYPLASLSASSSNSSSGAISTQAVTTTGLQTYSGNLTVAGTLLVNTAGAGIGVGGTTTLATGGGSFTLTGSSTNNKVVLGAVNGAQPLAITAGGGSVSLGVVGAGSGGAPTTVTIGGSSAPTISLNSVTSSGSQTYNGAVTLASSSTFTTTANGPVDFASTVDAASSGVQALTVNAGSGAATFGGIVGGGTPLTGLTLSSGTLDSGGKNVTVDGAIDTSAGAWNLGGGGTVKLQGNLTLGSLTGATGSTLLFDGSTEQTFTTNGNPLGNVTLDSTAAAPSLFLKGNMTQAASSGVLTLTAGTLDANTYTITLGAPLTIGSSSSPVLELAGGELTGAATDNVTIGQGSLDASGSGQVILGGSITLNNTYASVVVGTNTFTTGAMSVSAGTFTQTGKNTGTNSVASLAVTGGSVVWDSAGQGGTLTVSGNLSQASPGIVNFNDKDVTIGGTTSGNITFLDLVIPGGKTVSMSSSPASSLTVLRTFTIDSGGSYVNNGQPLTLGGGSITNGTISDDNSAAGKQNLGAVTLVSGGSATTKTFATGILADSLSVGTSVDVVISPSNNLQVTGSVTGAGTLDASAVATGNTVTIGSNLTVATFDGAAGTTSIGGNFAPTTYADDGGTVDFTGTGNSSGGASVYTFSTLALSGGTRTSNQPWTVTSALNLTGGTWDPGSYTHKIAGNWNDTAITFAPTAGTIELTGANASITQKSGNNFYDLTLDGSGDTLSSALATNGTLTVANGASLTTGNNAVTSGSMVADGNYAADGQTGTNETTIGGSLSGAGSATGGSANVTVGGSLTVATYNATSATTYIGANLSSTNFAADGGTVDFTGSGTISTAAGFANLTKSGTGTTTAAVGLTVSGNLGLASGTLAVGSNALAVGGNVTQSGGSLTSSSTVTLDGSGAQSADFTGSSLANLTVNNTFATAPQVTLTNTAGFPWSGNLTLTSGTLKLANDPQTIGGSVSGAGTLDASAVTGANVLTVSGSMGSTGSAVGALDAPTSATLDVGGNWDVGSFSADSGTVDFNGTSAQSLNPVGGPFANLTKSGGSTLSVVSSALTVSGTLTTATANDRIDLGSENFTIATLANNGWFVLAGSQTQSISSMGSSAGIVEYDGSAGETVGGATMPSTFYDLYIDGSGTFSLAGAITVKHDLYILSGTLDVTGNNYGITLGGASAGSSWDQVGGPYGSFNAEKGTVKLVSSGPAITIAGSNSFYNLSYTNASTSQVVIKVEQGSTQTIESGGTLTVQGNSSYTPTPATGSVMVESTTHSGAVDSSLYWTLDFASGANLSIAYATVWDSDASPNTIVTPVNILAGAAQNDKGWVSTDVVASSSTVDSNNDGKIDEIKVTTQVAVNDDFSGFQVSVPGYTVTGYSTGSTADDNVFYIELAPGPNLDTSATPTWYITSNNSLYDAATGDKLVGLANPSAGQTPTDGAPPTIGYTLAIAGRSQVYMRFSEPVVESPGGATLQASDFSFASSGGTVQATSIDPLDTSGAGTSALLINFPVNVTAAEEVAGAAVTVNPAQGLEATPSVMTSADLTHRVSDIGLGLPGSGVVEPLWAQNSNITIDPTRGGLGIIHQFDGSQSLQAQDVGIQAVIDSGVTATTTSPSVSLVFDDDVPASLEANGLWLPTYDTSNFNGIVPSLDSGAGTAAGTDSTANPHLRNFVVASGTGKLNSGSTLEFLFSVNGSNPLFCARDTDPGASNWYDYIVPWSFDLRNIITQRSSVTILNNVINPLSGQKAYLMYTVSSEGSVTINVFDLAGDLVNTLHQGLQSPGQYSTSWDGRDSAGRAVARGIYFIRVVAPGVDEYRKVLVVK